MPFKRIMIEVYVEQNKSRLPLSRIKLYKRKLESLKIRDREYPKHYVLSH